MTTINPAPQRKRRRSGPGFTLPGFSEKYDIPIGTVRRAVRDGQITTVTFGGRNLITPAEAERIAAMFDLKAREGNDGMDHEDKDQERN